MNAFISICISFKLQYYICTLRTKDGKPPADRLIVQQVSEQKLGLKYNRERENNSKETAEHKEEKPEYVIYVRVGMRELYDDACTPCINSNDLGVE